jgi:glucokinase
MTYILMDVGGTQIKAQAYVEGSSPCTSGITVFDANSRSVKSEIFEKFAGIIDSLLIRLPGAEQRLDGIGMAFPGPFDYENGISLMHGIGKYDAIYGCNIRQELKKIRPKLIPVDLPFVFLHDVEAFALGKVRFGDASQSSRVLFVCIGTGAGSAFCENGLIIKEPVNGVPKNGWIYNTAYREGIIDDYVSVRGLEKISERFFEKVLDGAALSILCNQGDSRALAVYSEFGEDVAQALAPFLLSFKPNTLVLGGQISKSFCYFSTALEKLCFELGIKIAISFNTSESILKGLMSVLTESRARSRNDIEEGF